MVTPQTAARRSRLSKAESGRVDAPKFLYLTPYSGTERSLANKEYVRAETDERPKRKWFWVSSRAKPFLMDLERQAVIDEAWLNRTGTIVAIVWSGAAPAAEVAKLVFERHEIPYRERRDDQPSSFRKGWFRRRRPHRSNPTSKHIFEKSWSNFEPKKSCCKTRKPRSRRLCSISIISMSERKGRPRFRRAECRTRSLGQIARRGSAVVDKLAVNPSRCASLVIQRDDGPFG